METTKLFRIASILMLMVGVLGLITTGSQLLYLTEVSIGYTAPDAIVTTGADVSVSFVVVVAFLGAGLRTAAGAFGLRMKEGHKKYVTCLVLCLLVFAASLIVKITDLVVLFDLGALVGTLVSLIVPFLYLISLLKGRKV